MWSDEGGDCNVERRGERVSSIACQGGPGGVMVSNELGNGFV